MKKTENIDSLNVLLSVLLEDGSETEIQITKVSDAIVKLKFKLINSAATACRGYIALDPVEEIYGFGEMWNGKVAQRGSSFELWDVNGTPDECAYMPYYVSTKNYALFINYGGMVRFDVGKKRADELVFEAETGQLELFLITGDNISSVVKNFLTEVGLPALPPRWAFKPWAWLMTKPNNPTADLFTVKGTDVIEMINHFEDLDIPVGVTWLEPPWQSGRTSFMPNPNFSPNLKQLISNLDKKGVKTLAWTLPYTSNEVSNWKTAVEKGFLAKKPGRNNNNGGINITESGEVSGDNYNYIDFFNPEACDWYKSQINLAIDLGFKGFKLDDGQEVKSEALLYNDIKGYDVHNSYALEYNKVFFEALTERYGTDFLMIPRSGWVGASSFTNFKWPGDLRADFGNNGMQSSLYSSLSLAFSGYPFVSTDIGGFYPRASPERVWIRWAQFGAMLPGMQGIHMPWWYSNKAIEHYKYLSWLHTDIILLWSSLAKEAHQTGAPVCRPLVWTYQDDVDCWRIDDQYTVGNDLLVAPIINSEDLRKVYFPEGRWIDFWNEKNIIEGNQTLTWYSPLWQFPLFIREGAIIPFMVGNSVTGFGWEQKGDFITLAIWPKLLGLSEFVLDDLEGPVKINVDWQNQEEILISLSETKMDYIYRIHFIDSNTPSNVLYGAETITRISNENEFRSRNTSDWYFDEEGRNLWVRIISKAKIERFKISLKSKEE